MVSKPLNIGVIGLGEQGWDNLLPSLACMQQANIKAVCDLDPERRLVAARNYGARPYEAYMDMLNREQLDAVVVASHPNVHAAVLEASIVRGLPVFVEKPPTLHTDELYKLIELNRVYKTVTAVGLNFSFTEPVQFVKRMMRRPEFGQLSYMRVCHYGNKPTDTMWGLHSRARSFLLSQAIHPLGLVFDLGRPTDETPVIHAYDNDAGLLFNVNMRLADKRGNDFTAELLTTSTSPFFEWQLQLISNRGVMININSLWEVEVFSQHRTNPMIENQKWWRDMWRPSPLSGGFKRNGYQNQFAEFFANIALNRTNHTSIERMVPLYTLMDEMEGACEEQSGSREQIYQYR
jgi:predicted dehydrogenase